MNNGSTANSQNQDSPFSQMFNLTPIDILKRMAVGLKGIWWLMPILSGILSLLFVMNAYKNYTPVYSASATVSIFPRTSTISSYSSGKSSEELDKTFAYILTSSQLSQIMGKDLGLGYVPGTIYPSAMEGTGFFTVVATSNSYEMAYQILKSALNNYSQVAEYIVGETELVIITPPTASSVPISTITYRTYALEGAGLGIAIVLVLATLLEIFNFTVRTPDDVEKLLNTRKIGTVVKVINKKSSNVSNIVSLDNLHVDARFKEAILSLRNSIMNECEEKHINSFVITSTGAGEGKTTLSSNLAISFAKKHYNTIIIDCDLRHPSLRGQFVITEEENELGIVDVITGRCTLEEALVRMKKSGLYVLPGTIPVENAAELIGSKQMHDLIKALESMFDYVIIDAPPVGIVADALEFKDYVGGVLFVVRQD